MTYGRSFTTDAENLQVQLQVFSRLPAARTPDRALLYRRSQVKPSPARFCDRRKDGFATQ
jgi:hypothetical protein